MNASNLSRLTRHHVVAIAVGCATLYAHGAFAGAIDPFQNAQRSLALQKVILDQGVYPTQNPNGTTNGATIGFLYNFAGSRFVPGGSLPTLGQSLSTSGNNLLYSILGNTYGGDASSFNLPNLSGRLTIGAGPGMPAGTRVGASTVSLDSTHVFDNRQPSLAVTPLIAVTGNMPTLVPGNVTYHTFLGEIAEFAGPYVPSGWAAADGSLLSIAQNAALFSILGTTYGGNGITTFALPDLRGRTAVGADAAHRVGTQYGEATTTVTPAQLPPGGAAVNNVQPSLAITYLLADFGLLPDRSNGSFDDDSLPTYGEVLGFAGDFVPNGYLAADGRVLNIADHRMLFSVIGDTFGGNGVTTFALPNLNGRAIVGYDDDHPVGTMYGSDQVFLTGTIDVPGDPSAVPEPGTWALLSMGLGVFGFTTRKSRKAHKAIRAA